MFMTRKDLRNSVIIGAAVGILFQPILTNISPEISAGLGRFFASVPDVAVLRVWSFLLFLIAAPLALAAAAIIGRFVPVVFQFAKFAAVGTLNSFVDLGLLNLGIAIVGFARDEPYVVFKAISFVGATTNSFFWNKYWTFSAMEKPRLAEAVKFYAIAALAGIVNVSAASFVVNVIPRGDVSEKLWGNVGALVGIFCGMLFNFLGYKFVVFTRTGQRIRETRSRVREWLDT